MAKTRNAPSRPPPSLRCARVFGGDHSEGTSCSSVLVWQRGPPTRPLPFSPTELRTTGAGSEPLDLRPGDSRAGARPAPTVSTPVVLCRIPLPPVPRTRMARPRIAVPLVTGAPGADHSRPAEPMASYDGVCLSLAAPDGRP